MLARLVILVVCGWLAIGCSRQPQDTAASITPPAAWGSVVEDKRDEWSGAMVGSTREIVDAFIDSYRTYSVSTQVEEKSDRHAVLCFDYSDVVRGMAIEAGMTPPPQGKPSHRRLLIEVTPDGNDFAVRTRMFDISK